MLQKTSKGFTLVELLVIITIIGILATGAITVYTSQIQKARDTTRIKQATELVNGIEQAYQDAYNYPDTSLPASDGNSFSGRIKSYVPRLAQDPLSGQKRGNTPGSALDYLYVSGPDSNGLQNQSYELSITFEQQGNIDNKAQQDQDGGDDNLRFEFGSNTAANNTVADAAITGTSGGHCWDGANGLTGCGTAGDIVVIRSNY